MRGIVYILKSTVSGRYYVGSTNNLERRMSDHNSGFTKSTKSGLPWILCYSQSFSDLATARKIEYKIKSLKRKDYLERIIADGVIKLASHGV